MPCIPISNADTCTLVDASLAKRLAGRKIHMNQGYACVTNGSGRKAKRVCLHEMQFIRLPGQVVDHINGNRLDNRKKNLRVASRTQNNANADTPHNRTGFKGVIQKGNRFRAYAHEGPKTIYIGSYKTAEEAACAYDKDAKRRYGRFAKLNGTC